MSGPCPPSIPFPAPPPPPSPGRGSRVGKVLLLVVVLCGLVYATEQEEVHALLSRVTSPSPVAPPDPLSNWVGVWFASTTDSGYDLPAIELRRGGFGGGLLGRIITKDASGDDVGVALADCTLTEDALTAIAPGSPRVKYRLVYVSPDLAELYVLSDPTQNLSAYLGRTISRTTTHSVADREKVLRDLNDPNKLPVKIARMHRLHVEMPKRSAPPATPAAPATKHADASPKTTPGSPTR